MPRGIITDHTGKRYGKLVALKRNGTSGQGHNRKALWLMQCDCGNQKTVAIGKCTRKRDAYKSCGCIRANDNLGMLSTANQIFINYRTDGNIKFSDFLRLTKENCHYCNTPPNTTRKHRSNNRAFDYTYNGLDRKNNEKGHDIDNVVPCCTRCNYMKREMGYEEFKAIIKTIYFNMELRE